MRILFITATRIGDAVISTGVLSALVDQYPQAKITVACGPLAASLFTHVPGLDRVIIVTKKRRGGHWFALWGEVKGERWDVVVDLRRSLLSYFIRASQRLRLGPDDHKSHRVPLLSGVLGLDPPASPKIWISQKYQTEAKEFLAGDGKVVALCPVAARPEKTWPVERYIELAQSLLAQNALGAVGRLLLVGAEADRPVIEQIASNLPADQTLTLLGNPDLLSVGAILSQSTLTIANDSGLAHLAAAVGCPTIALFGPTRDDLYRPWGQNVQVICAPKSAENRLISDISVVEVQDAATPFLA